MAENTGISMEEVFKLIAKMSADQQENMMKFAAELKKPSDREQKEIDAKEARIKQNAEARLNQAKAEELQKEYLRTNCPHGTAHPGTGSFKHAWVAQVHTPGHGEKPYFRPFCQQCKTLMPKITASADMLTQGVNLDKYVGIDADRLKKWAEQAA